MSYRIQADVEQLRITAAALREFNDVLHNHHQSMLGKAQAFLSDLFRGDFQAMFEDVLTTFDPRVYALSDTAADWVTKLEAFAQRLEAADASFGSQSDKYPNWIDKLLGPKEARVIVEPEIALRKLYDQEIDLLESTIANRQQELRNNNLPVTNRVDTDVYSPRATLGTILLNPRNFATIEAIAKRYNIPPDLLMGVVASEMDFDHDGGDQFQDFLGRRGVKAGQGQGIASVHSDALAYAKQYLIDHKLDGYEAAKHHSTSAQNLASFDGSVESAAIVTKALLHHKGTVESVDDNATIWGAYRNGVKDFSPPQSKPYGYNSQADFQDNRATASDSLPEQLKMGKNAYMSQPYFEFFQKAVRLKKAAEERNQYIYDHPYVDDHRV
ncbi:MAG: WXG100 family type VII secretion target [Chloroflexi bacterium]|nr:WXG100 family type VII secretion target [Chloroflexota bacterium]